MSHLSAGDNKRLLPAKQVLARYGGIVDRTLARGLNDPKLNFPKPLIVNGRRYFDEAKLETSKNPVWRRITVEEGCGYRVSSWT